MKISPQVSNFKIFQGVFNFKGISNLTDLSSWERSQQSTEQPSELKKSRGSLTFQTITYPSTSSCKDQKRLPVFHQGFQILRKRWKHDAEGGVLFLFWGALNPWWKTKHEFLIWLLKLVREFCRIIWESIGRKKACSIGDRFLVIHMVN